MNIRLFAITVFLVSIWIFEVDSRKVTQAPKKAPPPPPPPPKKDKSWVRSKIDSAKEKYQAGKEKVKSKIASFGSKSDESKSMNHGGINQKTTAKRTDWQQKTTKSYGWNSNIQVNQGYQNSLQTTKKPLFDRIKEKAKGSEKYVGKAVGWAKKDLGIGVEGPKKPSKILKYGKKAVDYVFKKKSSKSQNIPVEGYVAGSANFNGNGESIGYSGGSYSGPYGDRGSSELHQKVEFLRNRVKMMQEKIQGTWNTSEAGTKYKIFEEKKNWNDAQLHCEELGSNLAYLDSESKNNYAKFLIDSQNVTMVWFGLRTEIGSETQSQDHFSSFSNLDGCGVVDRNGTWSISTCSMELPYLCQAFRFDVLVEIP